jgi:hypothetical protein
MTETSDDTLVEVMHMINEEEKRFLDLAALLRRLKVDQPEAFLNVVNLPKLGRRKAYYLVAIDEAFGGLPHLRPRLLAIGWTKLADIASLATAESLEALLQLAENHTVHELKLLLKGIAVKPGGRAVLLYLGADEFQLVRQALRRYGAKDGPKGLMNKEAALVAALSKLAELKALETSPS